MATTPAALAPEATAAHSTEYEPLLALDRIHVHPHNPRHQAIADEELIDSIREQGLIHDLVVAPHPKHVDDFILIDGHRRLDGLTKAGYSYAPAKIRLDLVDEADQIAAMLATIRREDLTPIEEAEGFDLLAELGWKIPQIAAATGRSASTIKARRKLLSLNAGVQKRVNDGQVTIDDALAVAALPAKEQTKVASQAGTYNFKYELEAAQRRVKKQAEIDAKIVELEKAGIPERTLPKGKSLWTISDADDGMVRLGATFSHNIDDHPGCVAYVRMPGPELDYLCTNVSAHDEQLDAARLADRVQAEKDAAEQRAHEEALAIAQRLRADAILDSIRPGVKLDSAVERALRLQHRSGLFELGWASTRYFDALEIPEDQRWERYVSSWKEQDVTNYERHLESLTKPAALLRAFAALVVAKCEESYFAYLGDRGPRTPHAERATVLAHDYLELAQAAGHELTAVELDLLAPPALEQEGES